MNTFKSIWSCDVDPNTKIAKGTVVKLPYVWGYTKDDITPEKDIEETMANDGTLADALALVEKSALEYVRSHGAEDIRQYYIEDVEFTDTTVIFDWGT